MKNSFKCYIDSATAHKRLFDETVNNVRNSLTEVIAETSSQNFDDIRADKNKPVYSTGWLRGSLSYPWALSIIVPSFLEAIF